MINNGLLTGQAKGADDATLENRLAKHPTP
jgi:hypothetical protein